MKAVNVYDQSENKNSTYDLIHKELAKYFVLKFNEIALEFEISDINTSKLISFNEASLLIHLNRENIKANPQVIKTYLKTIIEFDRKSPNNNYWERSRDTAAPRCYCAFGKLQWDAWFIAVLCVWVAQFVLICWMFPHSPPYSQWVAPFRIFVYVLLNFCGFSLHFRSSWLAWAPLWTHPAPDLLKCRKLCEKWFPMSGVLGPLATLGAAMGPIGEPLVPNMCPIMASSWDLVDFWKCVFSYVFSMVFEGWGCQ